MGKFRKKLIIVEAEQIPPAIEPDRLRYYEHLGISKMPFWTRLWSKSDYGIKTLEGWHIVRPGDWIITGVASEKYPCKNDIFKETYEAVSGL